MAITIYDTVDSGLIGESTNGATTTYLADELGSVARTVRSGAVLNRYRYSPYGNLTSKSGAGVDPNFMWIGSQGYRSTGRSFSEEYLKARHYSTVNALWISRDPVWPRTSPYAYANNMPVAVTDASGLYAPCSAAIDILLANYISCDTYKSLAGNAYQNCHRCAGGDDYCSCSVDYSINVIVAIEVSGCTPPCQFVSSFSCNWPFTRTQICVHKKCTHIKCDENKSCYQPATKYDIVKGKVGICRLSGFVWLSTLLTGTVELCDF